MMICFETLNHINIFAHIYFLVLLDNNPDLRFMDQIKVSIEAAAFLNAFSEIGNTQVVIQKFMTGLKGSKENRQAKNISTTKCST